jgi:hypothetical protein
MRWADARTAAEIVNTWAPLISPPSSDAAGAWMADAIVSARHRIYRPAVTVIAEACAAWRRRVIPPDACPRLPSRSASSCGGCWTGSGDRSDQGGGLVVAISSPLEDRIVRKVPAGATGCVCLRSSVCGWVARGGSHRKPLRARPRVSRIDDTTSPAASSDRTGARQPLCHDAQR